jgi:3-phenylpropionate/trans-cinnamate dioxygenase ferredoxin reductase subunit
MNPSYDYVLLGGGTSCGYAARGIRELDTEGSVCIVSADSEPPYDRPPLSKGFLKNDAREVSDAHANEDSFYTENDIDLALEKKALSIDLSQKVVSLEGGESVSYGKLLYALGSEPRKLPVPGTDDVWVLRTARDSERVKAAAKEGAKAVIVGGGYIGTEVAASLMARGVYVDLIEAEPKLHRYLPDAMSHAIQRQLESMGATLHLGTRVAEFADGGKVVNTADGKSFPADFVIQGVGATPRTSIAEKAGIAKGELGLLADSTLKAQNGVWLAGDVVEYPDPIMGHNFRAEHHMHAQWTGQHAGRSMAGSTDEYKKAPYFFSDIGPLSFILRGDPGAEGRTFDVGSEGPPRLSRLVVLQDGRLGSFNDLRTEWSEQEPLVDLVERIIENRVPVEPLVPAMASRDFDPARLGELLT